MKASIKLKHLVNLYKTQNYANNNGKGSQYKAITQQ